MSARSFGKIVWQELARHGQIDGIEDVANHSSTICEIIGSLERRPIYITHEATERRLDLLKSGPIDIIINQDLVSIVLSSMNFVASYVARAPNVKVLKSTNIEIMVRETVI